MHTNTHFCTNHTHTPCFIHTTHVHVHVHVLKLHFVFILPPTQSIFLSKAPQGVEHSAGESDADPRKREIEAVLMRAIDVNEETLGRSHDRVAKAARAEVGSVHKELVPARIK